MKEYAVKVTKQAQEHILNYAFYIRDGLLNPSAAERFVRGIWKEIKTLGTMPRRFPCLEEEPWKTMGVRRMVFKGYLVYYLVDEENAEVAVVGVVLGRRDQSSQLEQMSFE